MAKSLQQLDLLALLADGMWGPLRIGMTRSEVEQLLGPPTASSLRGDPDQQRFGTVSWDYGVVELLFEGNRLIEVRCDRPELVDLDPPVDLDAAEVRQLHGLTFAGCELLLDLAAVGYDVVDEPESNDLLVHSESGGELRFHDGHDPWAAATGARLRRA